VYPQRERGYSDTPTILSAAVDEVKIAEWLAMYLHFSSNQKHF